jgi:hypothetical protein
VRRQYHFEGLIQPDDVLGHPYLYVPFAVPPRCSRIEVAYHFAPVADTDEPATIDIGVFDVRGTEPYTGGFRGWSGSDRRNFFIERHIATPGYVAGPLPAGTWSVILGGYEISAGGVRYWLTVSLETADAASKQPVPAGRPTPHLPRLTPHVSPLSSSSRPGWYRGDLHSHTDHSDGENTIAEMAVFAKKRGLEFLAITDHNTITHMPVIDAWKDPPLLLVPGEEVTTYSGHANVWGLRQWVDFRFTTDAEIHSLLHWVEARNRPFSINHPKKVGPPWKFADPGFGVREVWQAPWRWYNWESVNAWEEQLVAGRRIVPVGGSDAHSATPTSPGYTHHVGEPTTWLYCETGLNEPAILKAITTGRTTISDGPKGPFLTLEQDAEGRVTAMFERAAGADLEFIADGERKHRVAIAKAKGSYTLPPQIRFDRYLRAELRVPGERGREDVRALCAPVYR